MGKKAITVNTRKEEESPNLGFGITYMCSLVQRKKRGPRAGYAGVGPRVEMFS